MTTRRPENGKQAKPAHGKSYTKKSKFDSTDLRVVRNFSMFCLEYPVLFTEYYMHEC